MRTGVLTLRSKIVGLVLGAFLAFGAVCAEPIVSTHEAAAEEIAVGTELQAMDDVQISRAEIAKGSKVSVTKILLRQGDLTNVDIALADGQVIKKVAIRTIRAFFRVLGS